MSLLRVYIAISVPLGLSFWRDEWRPANTTYQRLKVTSDVLLFLDIAFTFFRAYETNGRAVYGLRKIAWKYLRFGFWFQLITSMPWDRLLAASWGHPREFLRLIQLLQGAPSMRSNVDMYNIDSNYQMATLFMLSASILVAIHLLSCATHVVAQHTVEPDVWLGVHGYLDHLPGMQYATCLYWTLNTMLGERSTPQDEMSTLLSLFLFVSGLVMYFGYGSVLLTYVGTMTMTSVEFKKKMWLRASYLDKLQVPEKLRKRIIRHFIDMHRITDGVDAQAFMAELPTHLRQEMASLLNDGIIGDLFSEIFSECSPPFVAAILLRLELMVAVKGDILCCEGDVGEEMFFVLHGTLDVYKDDLKLGELEAGDFFGEGTLMGISERLQATIQVTEDTVMYRLSQKAFQEASDSFPDDVRMLQVHAISRAADGPQ